MMRMKKVIMGGKGGREGGGSQKRRGKEKRQPKKVHKEIILDCQNHNGPLNIGNRMKTLRTGGLTPDTQLGKGAVKLRQ